MSDSVIAILENPDRRLLVHQKQANVKNQHYANLFGVEIDTRIKAGESNEEAIVRRLKPLGILKTPDYLFSSVMYGDNGSNKRERMEVYIMVRSTLPVDEKSQKLEWMDIKQVDNLLERSVLCPISAHFYPIFRDKYRQD